MALSVRKRRFCEAVAAGMSYKAAYFAAGYEASSRGAEVNASKLVRQPEVSERIETLLASMPVTGRAALPLPTKMHAERRKMSARLRFEILERDGFRCRLCGASPAADGATLHVDHIVPITAGGTSVPDNLQALCRECNLGKGGRRIRFEVML